MGDLVRKFATRVLVYHALAFLAVLALVLGASIQLYLDTRRQVLDQSRARQELVASQTARAVGDFFDGILDNLDLLRRSEGSESMSPRERENSSLRTRVTNQILSALSDPENPGSLRNRPATRPFLNAATRRGLPPPDPKATAVLSAVLWRQLDNRITHLFTYDPATSTTTELGRRPDGLSTDQVAMACQSELNAVVRPTVSRAHSLAGHQFVVVYVPTLTPDRQRRIFAAVVPSSEIKSRFLAELTDSRKISYVLLDEFANPIATSDPAFATFQLSQLESITPLPDAASANQPTSRPFRAYVLADGLPTPAGRLDPSLIIVSSVDIEGPDWTMVLASPLAEFDALVNGIFRKTLFWSSFLVLATALLLISTSTRLIRDRLRLEREQQAALRRDIEQARHIQLDWLPSDFPADPRLAVYALNVPASHVSGDLYNWFPLPGGRTAFIIGDVTGHGMSAAMQMSSVQLLVLATLRTLPDPGEALTQVNATLCLHDFSGQFVTLLIAIVDPATSTLSLATAGHPAPLLRTPDSPFQSLAVSPELMVGIEANAHYSTQQFQLPPNSTLLLYTDGLPEAAGPNHALFELSAVLQTLSAIPTADPATICSALATAVDNFRGPKPLADDLTLLAIHIISDTSKTLHAST